MNIELQAALNPAGERKVERFSWTFGYRLSGLSLMLPLSASSSLSI
ncbi:hypothetical protein [Bradyrhizobium sp.]